MDLSLNYKSDNLELRVKITAYCQNNNLALMLHSKTDLGFEPFCTLTVNPTVISPKDCSFINTNLGIAGILEWIERYGLAVPTGRYAYSGYCEYPEYQFNPEVLRELDPDGYSDYLDLLSQQVSD